MNLALCAGFLTATVLLYSWAYGAFRNENSSLKSSSMNETLAVSVCVALTGLLALTIAFGIASAIAFKATLAEMNAVYLAAIAVCIAMCVLLPRRIRSHASAGHDNPTGSAPTGSVSSFPGKVAGKKSTSKFRKAA